MNAPNDNQLPEHNQPDGAETEQNIDRRIVDTLTDNRKRGMDLLAKTYYRKAYGLALGMIGNRDDALDVTQETFIRIQRSFDQFDRTRDFFPWFYTILSNLCKTALSRRGKAASREVDFDSLQLTTTAKENPETEMLMKEQLTHLRRALAALSFEDREIITLKTFHEFSYDQIAKTLEIPRGTVMSRLYYARKRLAEHMNAFDNDYQEKTGAL